MLLQTKLKTFYLHKVIYFAMFLYLNQDFSTSLYSNNDFYQFNGVIIQIVSFRKKHFKEHLSPNYTQNFNIKNN